MFTRFAAALLGAVSFAALSFAQSIPQPAAAPAAEEGRWTPAETVVVTGRRAGYAADSASTATRTPTPLIEVPQSIQVLTRTLIEEQDLRTLPDALKNISGVAPAKIYEAVLEVAKIRGFDAEVFVDGLNPFGLTAVSDPASLINAERIEVAKGPSSTLFGGGLGAPVGGVINVVSKMPFGERAVFAGLRGGSFGTFGGFADVNVPLAANGAAGLRITGEYERGDSYVDAVKSERWSIYPTLAFQLGEATSLTLRGQFSRNAQLEYSGLPAELTLGPGPFIDPFRFSGAKDAPKTTISNTILTAILDHRFSDSWSASLTARYYDSRFNEFATFVFPAFFPPTGTQYPLLKGYLPTDVKQTTVSLNVIGRFSTGGLRHQLLIGADYDETDYFARIGIDFAPIGILNFANPASSPAFGALPALTGTQDDRYRTLAFYLQDQIAIGDRLLVTASLRWAAIDFVQRAQGFDETYYRLAPRIGATYRIADGVSLFAGYAQGFRAVPNVQTTDRPVPETSETVEAGVKFALQDLDLSGTLALFHTVRRNVPVADPLNPFAQRQTGEQRSQGFEADLIWEPDPSFSALFSYAYTDAEVTADTSIPLGDQLERTPRHSGRFALRYRFTEGPLNGLGIGLGLTAASKREITLPNSVATPGYTVAELQLSYDIGPVSLGLSVTNLTDERYFEPYQYLAQPVVIPGQPLSAAFSVSTRF
jgi:iron complex outermembrane recepter protein